MRKSAGVTKYEPYWQLLRASVKGPKLSLEEKLRLAEEFFLSNPTFDNWERVTNWMEGVRIVYNKQPDSPKYKTVSLYMDRMNRAKTETLAKEDPLSDDQKLKIFRTFADNDLKVIWEDLYKRNEKWSNKGYYHEEQNEFVALLAQVIEERGLFPKMKYKREDWENQVKTAKSLPNTHKFFF